MSKFNTIKKPFPHLSDAKKIIWCVISSVKSLFVITAEWLKLLDFFNLQFARFDFAIDKESKRNSCEMLEKFATEVKR